MQSFTRFKDRLFSTEPQQRKHAPAHRRQLYQTRRPPTYTPGYPGSAFWGWVGSTVGGLAGTAIGGTFGPVGAYFGSVSFGSFLGALWGSGSDMYFNFWNSNAGQWQSIDVSPGGTESAMLSTDAQGYSVDGQYDSSSNTVTVTIIPN